MRTASRWVGGMCALLATSAVGLGAGWQAAFWYTYIFLDDDRTGNADVATNISFLGLAVILGAIGLVVGFVVGWVLLARLLGTKTHAAPGAQVMEG